MKIGDYIQERGDDYVAFSEGNYYKVNNAVVYRRDKREVVLRNTWTGKEKLLKADADERGALNFMREFIKKGYKRI